MFNIAYQITVGDLKKRIQEALNVPPEEQKIIFQGKVLKDDKDLAFYGNIMNYNLLDNPNLGIQDGITLHMMRGKPPAGNKVLKIIF